MNLTKPATLAVLAAPAALAAPATLVALMTYGAGCGSGSSSVSPPPTPTTDGSVGRGDGGGPDPACDPSKSPICPISVSPLGDDAHLGTLDRPVKTLKRALAMAKKGQTISLGDGQYDVATGERWPEHVRDGVILQASGAGKVTLRGASDVDGLVFDGGGEIRGVVLASFRTALATSAGTLHASDIKVSGGGGFAFGGSTRAALTKIVLEEISSVGIRLSDSAHLDMDGGTIAGTTDPPVDSDRCANVGMYLEGNSTAVVNGLTVTNMGSFGLVAHDDAVATVSNGTLSRAALVRACPKLVQIGVAERASLTVEGSTVRDESGIAAVVRDESSRLKLRRTTLRDSNSGVVSSGYLDMESSVVEECHPAGIVLGEKSHATIADSKITTGRGILAQPDAILLLRRTVVATESEYAIRVENAQADLGLTEEPGGNHIFGKETGLSVYSKPQSRTAVRAAGNFWIPRVQGSDPQGMYKAQLVEGPTTGFQGNFSLSEGSTIQF